MGFGLSNAGVGLWFGWITWLLSLGGAVLLAAQLRSQPRRAAAIVALVFPLAYFLLLRLQRVAALRGWPVMAMLVLLTAVPPGVQAARWDYEERKTKTEELAAQWILQNLPPGKLILIDDPRIVLPPAFPSQHATRLLDEPLESYRSRGVAYLVTSSQQTDRYFSEPGKYAAQVAGWNRIYASTDMLQIIQPDQATHPGSRITILKIR